MSDKVKRADWVQTRHYSGVGFVKRVARNGSWADVDWGAWVKRMPTDSLIVQHTISVGDFEITDMTREKELQEER